MSWVYWGIVIGLVAMVATFFVCIDLLYSKAKGSTIAPSGKTDEPSEAIPRASTDHRQAA